MKLVKKHFFIALVLSISLPSCKVNKYLQIVDGSKSDGTLTMTYEYGGLQKPIVQWDAAKKSAIQKCQAWGYSGADFFDVGTSECIIYSQNGCQRMRVTYKCQCTN